MRLYTNRRLQLGLAILYPLLLGLFLTAFSSAFWVTALITMLVYCALWKNIGYVLFSNALLLVMSALLWVTERDYMHMGSVEETREWLPFAYILYGVMCLIPPLILVPLRNFLLRMEDRRR